MNTILRTSTILFPSTSVRGDQSSVRGYLLNLEMMVHLQPNLVVLYQESPSRMLKVDLAHFYENR